jgi:hypothetical protein
MPNPTSKGGTKKFCLGWPKLKTIRHITMRESFMIQKVLSYLHHHHHFHEAHLVVVVVVVVEFKIPPNAFSKEIPSSLVEEDRAHYVLTKRKMNTLGGTKDLLQWLVLLRNKGLQLDSEKEPKPWAN